MLRFGTVGTSWITQSYIRGAHRTNHWKLTAVYSRDLDRAEKFAEIQCKERLCKAYSDSLYYFDSIDQMAASDVIDAVYIASPNVLHPEQCREFLLHGKHVICEKPLCTRSQELEQLQTLAKQRDRIFMEAIMYMHMPQRKLLQQAIRQIGPISLVKLDYSQRSSKYDQLRAKEIPNVFNPAFNTGALMDIGIYCVYPALDLFGLPDRFSATAKFLDTGADGTGLVIMEYPKMLVNLSYSKIGQAISGSEFQGDEGTVYVDHIARMGDIREVLHAGRERTLYKQEDQVTLMSYEAEDFYQCIVNPGHMASDYQDFQRKSLMISKFMESLREKMGIEFSANDRF